MNFFVFTECFLRGLNVFFLRAPQERKLSLGREIFLFPREIKEIKFNMCMILSIKKKFNKQHFVYFKVKYTKIISS